MTNSYTDTKVHLVVNQVSEDQYEDLIGQDIVQDNEIYFVKEDNMDAGHGKIINVEAPTDNDDAANKQYVDTSTSTHNSSATAHTDIRTSLDAKQLTSNLVTSVSSSSTDTQYPSAKCVYDLIGNIENLIEAL